MEIREQRVGDFEFVRGINENRGPAAGGLEDRPLFGRDCFQHAQTRRANGNDAISTPLGFIYQLGGAGRELEPFFMHSVIFEVGRFYGSEGARPDVQSDFGNRDARGSQTRQ